MVDESPQQNLAMEGDLWEAVIEFDEPVRVDGEPDTEVAFLTIQPDVNAVYTRAQWLVKQETGVDVGGEQMTLTRKSGGDTGTTLEAALADVQAAAEAGDKSVHATPTVATETQNVMDAGNLSAPAFVQSALDTPTTLDSDE